MESTNGLSNSAYAEWLNNTASIDCSDVQELYIKYANGEDETLTNNELICSFMSDTDASEIALINEVKFSGQNEGPWHCTDKRLTVNLERTENFGDFPINIKRPPGG